MLVAEVSAVRVSNLVDSNSNILTDTRMEDGDDLNIDQYILSWNDPFGSIQMTRYFEKGWEFVVPVLCRDKGVWMKVNKHMGPLKGTHCMLVTCELTGLVKSTALENCPKGTFSTDIWEKDKPDRVIISSDAMVAIKGYVFQGPRYGAPPQSGHRNSVMDLSKTTPTEIGWEFSMSAFPSSVTPRFKEWNARSPNCHDKLELWSSYGIVPQNESSLTECKLKRNDEVLKCQAEWKAKLDAQTAWEWKEMLSKVQPADMKDVRKIFPDCTGWCDKEGCAQKPVPAYVTRDESKFVKLLQSKKRDCEDELDKYAQKHMNKCENIDTFCFGLWEELRPCAMTYGLPNEPQKI
jgi:hypothetical protein